MTTTAEGLLHLLRAEPALLPAAPADAGPEHIEHRRRDEIHECLRCGARAMCAYLAEAKDDPRWAGLGKRWLDLCPDCDQWLRRGLSEGGG